MTTKNSVKTCAVLRRKKPKQEQYVASMDQGKSVYHGCRVVFGVRPKGRKTVTVLAAGDPVPLPHDWPPYGGDCWRPAYEEMQSLQAMAAAWTAYSTALNATYMPPNILEIYARAYLEAKAWYLASWTAMENCLNMIV